MRHNRIRYGLCQLHTFLIVELHIIPIVNEAGLQERIIDPEFREDAGIQKAVRLINPVAELLKAHRNHRGDNLPVNGGIRLVDVYIAAGTGEFTVPLHILPGAFGVQMNLQDIIIIQKSLKI